MKDAASNRPLAGRPIRGDTPAERPGGKSARTITVNLAESPLGWRFARGHVSWRQLDAGDRLPLDWEKARLAPHVTMSWDAAPLTRSRGGSAVRHDPGRRPARLAAAVRSGGRLGWAGAC